MSHRRSSPEELRVLAEVLEAYKALPPRSEARRQMLEATCERLNGIRPDQVRKLKAISCVDSPQGGREKENEKKKRKKRRERSIS